MAGMKRWIYGLLALLSSSFATLLAVLASELHTEVSSNVAYLWFYLGASIVFGASLVFLSIALKRLNSN
jgi:multidrug transporter EmrE-like cation transporter